MRALCLAVALAIPVGLNGCGGSEETAVMPNVIGKKLDVAKSAITDAGFKDEIKIEGGGTFGIIKESNWTVCKQSPEAGSTLSDAPHLRVDRSCQSKTQPADRTESTKPTAPTETTVETPEPQSEMPALTPKNSEALRKLLRVKDYCDAYVAKFATKYATRKIAFDGSIVNVMHHDDKQSRYDILVAPGGGGESSARGPAFKFEDVNPQLDLGPSSVSPGELYHFVATVGAYNPKQCLFFLDPESADPR